MLRLSSTTRTFPIAPCRRLAGAQPPPEKTCESWQNRSRSAKETELHETSRRNRRALRTRAERTRCARSSRTRESREVCSGGAAGPPPHLQHPESSNRWSTSTFPQKPSPVVHVAPLIPRVRGGRRGRAGEARRRTCAVLDRRCPLPPVSRPRLSGSCFPGVGASAIDGDRQVADIER